MPNTTSGASGPSAEVQSSIAKVLNFGVTDYVVFVIMLFASAAVGVYYGFVKKSNNTTEEYLMGGRKMKVLPIAISLVASQLSAMSITSVSAEVYSFGINGIFGLVVIIPALLLMSYVILPIFYENNLSNCYQYLELRFGRLTRKLVTASFLLQTILFLPIFLYLPSMSFSQVSGYNVHLINCIGCLICVFYTMMGGVKAVVWTDVIQGGIMLISLAIVCIFGANAVGGWSKIFDNAWAGGRLHLNFAVDLRVRTTVWNNLINHFIAWSAHVYLNQICVQRIVALPSLQKAKKTICLAALGCIVIIGTTNLLGIIMFARYYDCDPIKIGTVSRPDRMISYFVQDVLGHLAGMPGLFIACVFSAALSTVSAIMNTLSGVIYLDCIKPFIKHSETKANRIMKLLVIVLGIYAVCGGFVVQSFGSILQTVLTISSLNMGALLSIYLAGFFMPRINAKVANVAFVSSMIAIAVLIFNNRNRFIQGAIRYDGLPTSVDKCVVLNLTAVVQSLSTKRMTPKLINTASLTTAFSSNREFSIAEISFKWFKMVGVLIFFIVAIPLSFIWRPDRREQQNPLLYCPLVRSQLKAPSRAQQTMPEQQPLNTAILNDQDKANGM